MEHAYFSNIRNEIIPYLDKASSKLQIAMAWFTSHELFATLLNSLNKGIEVDLVLLNHPTNYMEYAPDFNTFIEAGGILRIANPDTVGFMHHKFCIVDHAFIITGSYNWTYYAETRNIENIIISDNKELINLFCSEFQRLREKIESSHKCPRLTWDEIEERNEVDFNEMNEEIKLICEVRQEPVRRFFETKTEIIRTDIKLEPYTRYAIGILAYDDDTEVFEVLIKEGTRLPVQTSTRKLFFDSKNNNKCPCYLLFGIPSDRNSWHTIKCVDLMQVAEGTKDEDLPIDFLMRLEDNGSLRVDVTCSQSGKKLTISALNQNLVKYE